MQHAEKISNANEDSQGDYEKDASLALRYLEKAGLCLSQMAKHLPDKKAEISHCMNTLEGVFNAVTLLLPIEPEDLS